MSSAPPDGFLPYDRSSPFLDHIGPVFSRQGEHGLELGLRIDERLANNRGQAHAGVLCSLADVALGYATSFSQDPPVPLTTISLAVDFAGGARVGDFVQTRTDVQRIGRRIAFANCYLTVGNRRLVRASAVFALASSVIG